MPTLKPKLTIEQKADHLLNEAEQVYLHHFGELVLPGETPIGPKPTQAELNAAVFGYLYGMTLFNENDLIKEVAYAAMQKRFGFDDEYIATQIIGG